MHITKYDILKNAGWINGCELSYFCPLVSSDIEFDLMIGSKEDITPKIINILNDFLNIKEDKYPIYNNMLIDVCSKINLLDNTLLDEIINLYSIDPSDLLKTLVAEDLVVIGLLPPDCPKKLKNNYLRIEVYPDYYAEGIYLIVENGKLKTFQVIKNYNYCYPKNIYN